MHLNRLVNRGLVQRIGRGIYMAVDSELTEHYDITQVSRRIPHGVICLISALRFHDIGTQNPYETWVAIDVKAWLPKHIEGLRIVRFSGVALTYGVEEHAIDGVKMKIYSPAKTVADCFKYRNKIGLDVALEALRDCWRQRKATMDQLWDAAKVCRVATVMRPYLESLV